MMSAEDDQMMDADQLENLSAEDLVLMCNDAFDNIKMEEDMDEMRSEVETLFIPQLNTKLEETRDTPQIHYALAKNLCKCYTFLGNHSEAENCWRKLESYIKQSIQEGPNPFTLERNKIDVELSGVYVNLASLSLAIGNNEKTIELYQQAADVIMPWIFDQNDMSPVPSLLSVRKKASYSLQYKSKQQITHFLCL